MVSNVSSPYSVVDSDEEQFQGSVGHDMDATEIPIPVLESALPLELPNDGHEHIHQIETKHEDSDESEHGSAQGDTASTPDIPLPMGDQPMFSGLGNHNVLSAASNSEQLQVIANSVWTYERSRRLGNLPWETGLMGQVFRTPMPTSYGRTPLASVPIPVQYWKTDGPTTVTKPPIPRISFALARLRNVRLQPSEDALRTRALVRWRLILELDLESSQLSRTLKSMAEDLSNETNISRVLADAFASKSTSTLFKRASSIGHYLEWAKAQRVERPLLFAETHLYSYVSYLRSSNYKPTKAEAFKEAVAFCVHVLGMDNSVACFSNRFKGACHLQYISKSPLKQAPPLTVEQVRRLERLAMAAPRLEDRIIAGQFCFCVYASCRFSDSIYATDYKLTRASNSSGETVILIDAGTLRHKTATTRERATTFLPLLANGIGIEGDWATPWLKAREDMGLSPSHTPFLPAFLTSGRWSDRRMTTGEASSMLNDMLTDYVSPEGNSVSKPSTHSCKATVLSWLSKDGAKLELRRIAGHHMDPGSKSVLTYSRDALLSVMIRVAKIVNKIKGGTFVPDEERAEAMLRSVYESSKTVLPQASHVSESEDDIESIADASTEAVELWSYLNPDTMPPAIVQFPKEQVYRHAITGVIHLEQYDLTTPLGVLRCGRPLTSRYSKAVNLDPVEWPICKQCESNWNQQQ
jgi:hypothetical protein